MWNLSRILTLSLSLSFLFPLNNIPLTFHSSVATGDRSGINMAHQATPSSQKALMMELKSLQEQPVEGFRITLVEESDLYNWEVAIFGPPNTLYEGGYFKVGQTFLIPKGQQTMNTDGS